jgi:SAM-dependent methyltransferase
MDLATVERLLSAEGQRAMELAARLRASYDDPVRAGAALRSSLDPALAAAAMSQVVLRQQARGKHGDDASRMYFTPEALEQSTRREVAAHRAARVSFAHPSSVVDLGCGVGGDLVALARRHGPSGTPVAGVESDPVRAALAAANLRALDLPGAVSTADATRLDLSAFGVVVADPARRSARGRTFDPDTYVPSWAWVESLLRRPAVVKVAPGIPDERVPEGVETEVVSWRGAVKEAALWSPQLATTERRATVITPDGLATLTDREDPGGEAVGTSRPRGYLYEPDGAVIRAGLVTAVAAAVGGSLLDPRIAYVTSDREVATPYATGYEVIEELPFAEKRLRAALRERGIGRLTVKKRGVGIVPEQLRRRLTLAGDGEGTIVVTRVDGRATVLSVRPLTT